MSNINENIEKFLPVGVSKYSKKMTYLSHLRVEFDQAKMKFLIVLVILVFFGFTSVVSQKYLNQILELSGIQLKHPIVPTMTTFLTDFLGNSMIYVIIIIIFGGGVFANEVEVNKQVYFLLSRPISRRNYYFTRSLLLTFGMAVVTIVGSYIVYYYALVYFNPLPFDKVFLILVLNSFQFSNMYAFMILFNAKYNQVISWVFGILTYFSGTIITVLATIYDPLKWLSPFALCNDWPKILTSSLSTSDLFLYFISLFFIWTILPIALGWFLYKKRDL